jgi:hypothetical protein
VRYLETQRITSVAAMQLCSSTSWTRSRRAEGITKSVPGHDGRLKAWTPTLPICKAYTTDYGSDETSAIYPTVAPSIRNA